MSRTKQPAIVNITEELRASTYLAQGRSNIRTQEQTDIVRLGNIANKTYTGENLVTKFAQEIANFDNEWAWIKNRITNGNFDGLNVGDYIPVTCSNNVTFNARIAGINTYKNMADPAIGNHIDFISSSLWPTVFQMNKVNINNGLSNDNKTSWKSSNGYLYINSLAGDVPNSTTSPLATESVDYTESGIYYYLPEMLKNHIVEKMLYIPERFSANSITSDDNGGVWTTIGKLWVPTEYEIMGCNIWGGVNYAVMGCVQYPLFANTPNRIIGRANWWTITAGRGSSLTFIGVNGNGYVIYYGASSAYRVPVCFRIA